MILEWLIEKFVIGAGLVTIGYIIYRKVRR